MSEPDLFVVCKNCSSEVSPYVTECPYCGQRVRKRAPKIDRGEPSSPRESRRQRTSLPRLRRGEIPGIAAETRPYATLVLLAAALVVTVAYAADNLQVALWTAVGGDAQGPRVNDVIDIVPALDGDYWKLFTTSLQHADHFGYAFVALTAVGVFGTMLERRFGPAFLVATFLLASAAGTGLAIALDAIPAIGANGVALALLCAWLVDDRLAARRGNDRENDLLGVYVFAVVLLLLPVAEPDASIAAAAGGVVVGTVMGAIASPFRP